MLAAEPLDAGIIEAAEDEEIAQASARHIREVHDFFADIIREAQERGRVPADRDPEAEAWIFVAGGLLATIDQRRGRVGGDLLAARTAPLAAPVHGAAPTRPG